MKSFLSTVPVGASAVAAMLSASTCTTRSARADVAWQHSISVRAGQNLRVGSKPDAKMTLLNEWSGLRHRTLARVKSSDMQNFPQLPIPGGIGSNAIMHSWQPARSMANSARSQANSAKGATVDIVSVVDRENDTFLIYGAPKRTYIQEPLKATLTRLRFDPWKKLAPRLSEEPLEPLTSRQRARLGAEVRATYTPFIKRVAKLYFRPLNETRTVAGIEGRTYRMTALINTGTQQQPAWAQIRTQWVVANELPGDEEVRAFQKSSRELTREIGWPSASLWLNEMMPVLYQMLPQELHQSIETLLPREGMPREFFAGTPLELHLTVVPPPLERRIGGELRADILLERRSTETLPATIFQVPQGYTRTPLEPQLKKYDEAMQMIARRQADSPFLGLLAP